jgi:hypothetical protein
MTPRTPIGPARTIVNALMTLADAAACAGVTPARLPRSAAVTGGHRVVSTLTVQ